MFEEIIENVNDPMKIGDNANTRASLQTQYGMFQSTFRMVIGMMFERLKVPRPDYARHGN